jgi:tetratricopeptide (TPR) repeat protein
MFEKSALVLSSALSLLLLAACSSYVKRGEVLYADGRYIEAAEVFERTEGRIGEASLRQRAEYGMYRGLTLLVLGDFSNAQRWMNYAYGVERAAPGSLSSDRRALLDRGWYEVGQRLRAIPRQPAPTAVASSQDLEAASQSPRTSSSPDTTNRSFAPQR